MQAENVALGKNGIEVNKRYGLFFVCGGSRMHDHLHAKGRPDSGHGLTGLPVADNPEYFSAQFMLVMFPIAKRSVARPCTRGYPDCMITDAAGNIEDMRKDHLGDGSGAVGGNPRHNHVRSPCST